MCTIKARNRVSNLTKDGKAFHLALKADHADLSYYLKKTEKGTHASCIANQKVKNISASSSSPQAPPSTPPQLLSELAAFEDELSDEEIASIQALLTQARIDAHEESNFCKWQHFWDRCIRSYTRKAGKLRKKPECLFEYMPWIDVEEGTFHEVIPPHKYFCLYEQAVWTNFTAWKFGKWAQLPGPAQWYPKSYNLVDNGWLQVSTHSSSFKEAFLLVYSKKFDKEKWAKVSAAQDMLFLELE
ncbi:hypothetical protein VC83_07269 [Pseudogymnoascus destructans]|uniref:Uncharacterized protein n=1 Tax=Pseudogymnoascus destructans TaxID=655981 RepID=A0A177A3M2_9PEZI|nr:uncharacterized protein VC83_07269 [Pseudogymnoascus destructans]OAF56707.1 hypothetical protein VC83_07269 [Pseudogymnoascus destructans]